MLPGELKQPRRDGPGERILRHQGRNRPPSGSIPPGDAVAEERLLLIVPGKGPMIEETLEKACIAKNGYRREHLPEQTNFAKKQGIDTAEIMAPPALLGHRERVGPLLFLIIIIFLCLIWSLSLSQHFSS